MALAPIALAGGYAALVGLVAGIWPLLLSGLVASLLGSRRRPRKLDVSAGPEGVAVGDRFHPRAEILHGSLLHTPHRVLLHRRFPLPLIIDTTSTRQGRGLLRALGLDASQRIAEMRTLSPLVARSGSLWGGAVGLWFLWGTASPLSASPARGGLALALAAASVAWIVALVAPARVRVGTDGIGVRWLWSRRFFHFDEMAEIERFERIVGARPPPRPSRRRAPPPAPLR